jgi:MoaA/NifB/PqqE/SkfB family radical SAM enzyme
MELDERMSAALLDAGLTSIAFSLDVLDQSMADQLRKGTKPDRVLTNIRRFTELARSKGAISTAVFTAVSMRTLPFLPALIEKVAGLGVHVMMLSDLNFRENSEFTVWKHADAEALAALRKSVLRAFERKLPVLSVRALEEFDLLDRYERFLLVPPDRLAQRSVRRTYCCSPWQTAVVGVDGRMTVCDCQPDLTAGNVFREPFSGIWNGPAMTGQRRRMLSDDPPEACRLCPRF